MVILSNNIITQLIMKSLFLTLILLLSVNYVFAQDDNPVVLPRNEEGKVYFSEVVQVDSTLKQNVLYGNAKLFFANTFKSAQDVIQVDDKENFRIVGKGFSNIYITVITPVKVKMYYTISITCKDGRYKYEIYDIYYQGYPDKYYPNPPKTDADFLFSEKQYYNRKGKVRKMNQQYKNATEKEVQNIVEKIKKEMASGAKNGTDGDW